MTPTFILLAIPLTLFLIHWTFTRNAVINFMFPKPKATQEDLGKRVAILWNPQDVRDFGKEEAWREGKISHVDSDGGFDITFDDGAKMICIANKFGRDVNPFRNVKFLEEGKPTFEHDCDCCIFLGSFNGEDLYFHPGHVKLANTLISRYGSDGPEYTSGLGFVGLNTQITEAHNRAVKKGFLDAPKVHKTINERWDLDRLGEV